MNFTLHCSNAKNTKNQTLTVWACTVQWHRCCAWSSTCAVGPLLTCRANKNTRWSDTVLYSVKVLTRSTSTSADLLADRLKWKSIIFSLLNNWCALENVKFKQILWLWFSSQILFNFYFLIIFLYPRCQSDWIRMQREFPPFVFFIYLFIFLSFSWLRWVRVCVDWNKSRLKYRKGIVVFF